MKFSVDNQVLNNIIEKTVNVVPSNPSTPILGTILLEAKGQVLRCTATDLETTVSLSIPIKGEKDGSTVVPGKRFADILRRIPDIELYFFKEENSVLNFHTSQGKYMLGCEESSDDFPKLNHFLEDHSFIEIPAEVLLKISKRNLFAVSRDDLRPAMMGIYCDISPNKSCFVSTDGHRLVEFVSLNIKGNKPTSFIVVDKLFSLLPRIIKENVCKFCWNENHAQIMYGEAQLTTRIINDKYPNYKTVIPTENDKTLIINRELLFEVIGRVSVFSAGSQVQFTLGMEEIEIKAQDHETKSLATEKLKCNLDEDGLVSYDGEHLVIGFNARYLLDVLKHIGSKKVKFLFSNPNRAGVVYSIDESPGESTMMLIMPMMLNR